MSTVKFWLSGSGIGLDVFGANACAETEPMEASISRAANPTVDLEVMVEFKGWQSVSTGKTRDSGCPNTRTAEKIIQ